jgi:hypothetical protein
MLEFKCEKHKVYIRIEGKHGKIDSEGPLCAEALEFLRKSLGESK